MQADRERDQRRQRGADQSSKRGCVHRNPFRMNPGRVVARAEAAGANDRPEASRRAASARRRGELANSAESLKSDRGRRAAERGRSGRIPECFGRRQFRSPTEKLRRSRSGRSGEPRGYWEFGGSRPARRSSGPFRVETAA
ncbi:MAG TPA: hypothetical protein DCQ98_18975 [Planctomycetaceae bacterium]|nr:hypothetical protein [Planctomycetaceae bacterium]